MRQILEIQWVEERKKFGKPYYRVHALLEHGDTAIGWSERKDEFKVGDRVEFWYEPKYDMSKMRLPKLSS